MNESTLQKTDRAKARDGVRRPRRRQEGAAMIVVMMVLLSTTALAVFAIHSTTFEIRASGHARQAVQSQYVAETGLNAALARVQTLPILQVIEEVERRDIRPDMSGFETNLAEEKSGYRFSLADFENYGTGYPVDSDTIGDRQPYTPSFVVDLNDHYRYTGNVPGHRSDGHARFEYLYATYTSRGRMRLTGTDLVDPEALGGRQAHEVATDARAHAITGPLPK